jgi:hypothetical protein
MAPIEKRPKFKLGMLSRDSQPLGSKCYWFRAGESFVSIAQQLHLNPLSLIKFNFATTDPGEVNWYLREYIRYVRPTYDGNNWRFDPERRDISHGRKNIFVPLTHAEHSEIVDHYHSLILTRMKSLVHDFGDPQPQKGQPAFLIDPGRHGRIEMEYLAAIVGYAEVIRVLVWPTEYAMETGRDYLEQPPELPTFYSKRDIDIRKPRGQGYGKGFDAAVDFWQQTIENPPELRSLTQMKGVPPLPPLCAAINGKPGSVRLRIADELARTKARDLFDKMKQFIEDERTRFHGVNEPYIWSRP